MNKKFIISLFLVSLLMISTCSAAGFSDAITGSFIKPFKELFGFNKKAAIEEDSEEAQITGKIPFNPTQIISGTFIIPGAATMSRLLIPITTCTAKYKYQSQTDSLQILTISDMECGWMKDGDPSTSKEFSGFYQYELKLSFAAEKTYNTLYILTGETGFCDSMVWAKPSPAESGTWIFIDGSATCLDQTFQYKNQKSIVGKTGWVKKTFPSMTRSSLDLKWNTNGNRPGIHEIKVANLGLDDCLFNFDCGTNQFCNIQTGKCIQKQCTGKSTIDSFSRESVNDGTSTYYDSCIMQIDTKRTSSRSWRTTTINEKDKPFTEACAPISYENKDGNVLKSVAQKVSGSSSEISKRLNDVLGEPGSYYKMEVKCIVKEYYCKDSEAKSQETVCPKGCFEGRCISIPGAAPAATLALETRIANLEALTTTLIAQINSLQSAGISSALQSSITALQSEINDIKSKVATLEGKTPTTGGLTSAQLEQIKQIESKIAKLLPLQCSSKEDLNTIANCYNKPPTGDCKNADLDSDGVIGIKDTTICGKSSKVAQPIPDLSSIQSSITALQSKVTALEGKTPTPVDLSALQSDINTLKTKVATLEGKTPTTGGLTSAQLEQIKQIESKIAKLLPLQCRSMEDLSTIAKCYGKSTIGDCKNADLNNDGVVDVKDTTICSQSPQVTKPTLDLSSLESEISNLKSKIGQCDGCIVNNKCLKIGMRKANQYCSEAKEMKSQLDEDETCDNNYECKSNICADVGKCVGLKKYRESIGFIKDIYCKVVSKEKQIAGVCPSA